MPSKRYWDRQAYRLIDKIQSAHRPEECCIMGTRFEVLPGVFSPVYSQDTPWFAEKIVPRITQKRFLEIGTGSGVIACLAMMHGARTVVATDINPLAVENARLNAEKYRLPVSTREGNMFDPLQKHERFDVIFWNHPFNYGENIRPELTLLEAAVFDPGYAALEQAFRRAHHFLSPKGVFFLGTSTLARIRIVRNMTLKYHYRCSLVDSEDKSNLPGQKTSYQLRLYAFRPNKNCCTDQAPLIRRDRFNHVPPVNGRQSASTSWNVVNFASSST